VNWFQIFTAVISALPAIEQISVEVAQLILAISQAAAAAPATHQSPVVAAMNRGGNLTQRSAPTPTIPPAVPNPLGANPAETLRSLHTK
jgi:hypothetical protein